IRSLPGEHRRICRIRKKANPRPITAQTKAMGIPAVRRSRARIVMVARKAHDFMVKTLTRKGYLPWAGPEALEVEELKGQTVERRSGRTFIQDRPSNIVPSEGEHLLQSIEERSPVFLFACGVIAGRSRFFYNPFRLEAPCCQNLA